MATLKSSPIQAYNDHLEINVAAVGLLDSIDSLDLDVLDDDELRQLRDDTLVLAMAVSERIRGIRDLVTMREVSYR